MSPGLALKPRQMSNGQFQSSNVFVVHSRKLKFREVKLIGSILHDAWLLLEFDSDIAAFCERPPLDVELCGHGGRKRAFDFWISKVNGSQAGIIVFGSSKQDQGVTTEQLSESVSSSRTPCEIWHESDVLRRNLFLRNLKQMQPYLSCESGYSADVAEDVDLYIQQRSERSASLEDLFQRFSQVHRTYLTAGVFAKFHAGRVKADLESAPLSIHTRWQQR